MLISRENLRILSIQSLEAHHRIRGRYLHLVEAVLIQVLMVTIFTYSVPYSDYLSDHILLDYQRACCLIDRLCSPVSTQFNTTLT